MVCVPLSRETRTPRNNVVVHRRRKSKSYRLSYRSGLGAADSRLGWSPALTARRLNTSRKAAGISNIAVSWFSSPPPPCVFTPTNMCQSVATHCPPSSPLLRPCPKGEGGSGAAGLAGENGVAAVVRHSSSSVQTHPAEELRPAALCVHRRREAAGFGG